MGNVLEGGGGINIYDHKYVDFCLGKVNRYLWAGGGGGGVVLSRYNV